MPNRDQITLHHTLTLRIVELTIVILAFAVALRPLFTNLPNVFIWVAVGNLILLMLVYSVIRRRLLPKWEFCLCVVTAVAIMLPTLAISGGVNSQLAFFLPLSPLLAALIGGRRESIVVAATLIPAIVVATVFSEHVIDLTGELYSQEKTIDRGFWLVSATIFSTVFAWFFLQRYDALTSKLKEENIKDPLTNLYNRRGLNIYFEKALDNAICTASPISLILIDIDNFKTINDQYGHDVGDICLVEVANLLSANVRKTDIIARFGGEEFIIILPYTNQEAAALIADKLRQLVSKNTFSPFAFPLTITLGITEHLQHNDNALKMIKRADKALYKGKDRGRNRVEPAE